MQAKVLTSPPATRKETTKSITKDDVGNSPPYKPTSHSFVDVEFELDFGDSPDVTMEYSPNLIFSESDFGFHSGSISRQPVGLSIDSLAASAEGGDCDLDVFSPVSFSGTALQTLNSEYTTKTAGADFANIASPATQTLENLTFLTSDSSCACLYEAISIYEAIEANLASKPRKAYGTTDEILRHQKEALARCEGLFECRSCSTGSEHIMLVIVMCDKMLMSLENMELSVLMGDGGWGGNSESALNLTTALEEMNPRQAYLYRANESNPCSGNRGSKRGLVKERSRRASRSSGSSRNSSTDGRKLSIGLWQLDEEDELHVLQSLLIARMTRLGNLVGMIEEVVNGNYWPAHESMTRNLRDRFTQGMGKIKKMLRTK